MKYCYTAVLTPEENGYSVDFPDLENCFTCGETLEEALTMAEDALAMMLTDAEDRHQVIPPATPIRQVSAPEEAIITLILADTLEYRKRTSSKAVKKTLSIPSWLNEAAERENINFSQTLAEALEERLGFAG